MHSYKNISKIQCKEKRKTEKNERVVSNGEAKEKSGATNLLKNVVELFCY